MNINANELLLLNKKVRFGENSGATTPVVSEPVAQQPTTPEVGMKALMFQGMNNVAGNPQLAGNLNVLRDDITTEEKPVANDEQTAADTLKTNVAFQGKASKFKTAAMGALMGLMTLGAASTLQSCDVKQEVSVDMSQMMEMLNELKELRKDMAARDEAMAKKLDQVISMFNQVISLMQEQQLSNEQFRSLVLQNQEIIIDLMVQQGSNQEEAQATLNKILNAVMNGTMSIEEALNEIKGLVSDVKDLLAQVISALQKAEQDRAKLIELAQQGNANTSQLIEQGNALIESNKAANNKLDAIKESIEKANLDSNANFETVVKTINMSKDQLISVMIKLGYTQAQIEKMTAAEIIKAIKENTQVTKNNNAKLNEILAEVKAGNISAAEASKIIIDLLGQINSNILGLTDSFNNFVKMYKQDKNQEFKMLGELIKNNRVQTSILASMKKTQESMATNIEGIKANTDSLLNIASDDTRYKELIKTLKEIQVNGSTSIDYQRLEEMFKLMNMNITDAIKMSRSELVATIKDFQATYVETEQKQTEELQTIQSKIDDLQMFISNNGDTKNIVSAITKLTEAVNGGKDDLSAELKVIQAQLDKLQATADAILSAIGQQAAKADEYYNKWAVKFNAALNGLEDIKTQLNTITSNQKIAATRLASIENAIKDLKAEIQKLQNQGGGNIDYDKLDEMWQKHDDANYEKYSKLIKDLGLDPSKFDTIADLLKSIDAKMDYIKDNSDILTKILNKLNDLDKTSPDYNAKLDKIIDILSKFKFNCNCGNNNEGILDEIEDVLGK